MECCYRVGTKKHKETLWVINKPHSKLCHEIKMAAVVEGL